MSDRLTPYLTIRALCRAVDYKKPPLGLCHHSDRGSQYCVRNYRKLLESFGMISSMSGRGNCYDNAPMEGFWGCLKNELVHHQRYATRGQALLIFGNISRCFTIGNDATPLSVICRRRLLRPHFIDYPAPLEFFVSFIDRTPQNIYLYKIWSLDY